MSEEKILGGDEELRENQVSVENEAIKKDALERKESVFERSEKDAQEKMKQAEDQIVNKGSSAQKNEEKVENHAKDVASLNTVEDQIQKID